MEDIRIVDNGLSKTENQTSILLHSTPFRAMPATPLACKPMSYLNYRGMIAKKLGKGRYKGNIFYQGNSIWGGWRAWQRKALVPLSSRLLYGEVQKKTLTILLSWHVTANFSLQAQKSSRRHWKSILMLIRCLESLRLILSRQEI